MKNILINIRNFCSYNKYIFLESVNICFFVILSLICLFSLYLRLRVYSSDLGVFSDEVSVILNLFSSYPQLFFPLDNAQCTPPLFLIFYKFLYGFSGFNDQILKLPVFIFSVINIVLFCYLSLIAFKNKFSVLAANIIFAVSEPVILYSWVLKQYQSDITCTIIILIAAFKIKNKNLSKFEILFLSLLTAFFILFSYTSVFIIFTTILTLFLYKFFKKTLPADFIKKFFLFSIIPFVTGLTLFFVNCLPTIQNNVLQTFWNHIWYNIFFLPENHADFINMLSFFTSGSTDISNWQIILSCVILSFVFMLIKDKFSFCLLFLPFLLSVILGYFHLYPFCPERVCLYLIPVGILVIAKLIDNADFKKFKLSFLIVIVLIFCFYKYDKLFSFIDYINNFNDKFIHYCGTLRTNSKDFVQFLYRTDISENDYVVSDSFWASHNVIMMYDTDNRINRKNIIDDSNSDTDINILDSLDAKSNIYFYISSLYHYDGWNNLITDWINNNCTVEYEIDTYNGKVTKCVKSKKD